MVETGPYQARVDLIVDPHSEETQQAARRTAAKYALDADDLRMLLDMLGLSKTKAPTAQPVLPTELSKPKPSLRTNTGRCRACGIPTYSRKEEALAGARRYGARGMCATCYQRKFREENPAVRSYVDPSDVLDYLDQLRAMNVPLAQVAARSGVAMSTLSRLASSTYTTTRGVRSDIAEKILAVEVTA